MAAGCAGIGSLDNGGWFGIEVSGVASSCLGRIPRERSMKKLGLGNAISRTRLGATTVVVLVYFLFALGCSTPRPNVGTADGEAMKLVYASYGVAV